MQNANYIADRIKSLAREKKISVNKVLLACGINSNLVTDMRRRGTIPSAETLAKLADYFEVPIGILIGEAPVAVKNIGPRIRTARIASGLDIKTFSEKLHRRAEDIEKIESSEFLPDTLVVHQIADVLGVSAEDLLKPDNSTSKNVAKAGLLTGDNETPDLAKMLQSAPGLMFNGEPLSNEDREKVLKAIKFAMDLDDKK